ncbi:MAG TPA: DUF6351 family protein [Candidatus Binatia bacterium]|nr:DUF6351 family protein [Candidatus Binatia bacterium]
MRSSSLSVRFADRTLVLAMIAALVALLSASSSALACQPTSEPDSSDIAAARAAVASACECSDTTRRRDYLRCANEQARAWLANDSCLPFVKRCASRSTCGKRDAVTCCTTSNAGPRCRTMRGAERCEAVGGTVSACSSTCDALPLPGSGPTCSASEIRVLSNRADLVSAGEALVEIVLPAGVDDSGVTVDVGGEDVTGMFARRANGRFMGMLTGLAIGPNVVTAQIEHVRRQLTITNHPNGGPVFSGPQLQPWICQATAVDEQCNQAAEYRYVYKSTDPSKTGLQPYDPEAPPSDVASTTTDQGVTVPFIVRVETGYQDRDQYQISTLFQPDQPWTPWDPQPQWNHKVLIVHGASCGVDYRTGTAPDTTGGGGAVDPSAAAEYALGQGFATMSTALDNSGHNCNIALQAESLVMAKERLIEQLGEVRYTIGSGCSGGSLAVQWIANAYPGFYDGILPSCSFPDAWSTATQFLDYHLTLAYFLDPSKWGPGIVWTPNQMADVQGHISIVNSQVSDTAQFHVAVPTDPCAGVTEEQRYHPETNPGGVRCSIQDAAINVFGPRPPADWSANELAIGRGFAGVPIDNVGVQYGLGALQQGTITPAQFLDLNEKIGGLDVDTNFIPERIAATRPALANAYRSGMINVANNLDETAIIDCRGPDPGAFHDAYRAYAVRARLDREHGGHANQLIWEGPVALIGDAMCTRNSLIAMDRWLAAVEQDTSDKSRAQKLIDDKPADLSDRCYDGAGNKLLDTICGQAVVATFGTPRMVAGDALTTDTNKCQLKPLDRNDDYGLLPFTEAEWARMQTLFAGGVCDFSRPGVDQQGTIPWQTYQDASGAVIYGGQPMGDPPGSQ